MIDIIAVVVITALYALASDRKDKRHAEQVQKLCQRLQAPEQAVLEHAAQERSEGPLYVTEFDEDMAHLEKVLEAE